MFLVMNLLLQSKNNFNQHYSIMYLHNILLIYNVPPTSQ